jgi:hypothetical protein
MINPAQSQLMDMPSCGSGHSRDAYWKKGTSRRNLSPGQVSLIIGRRYERAKKSSSSNLVQNSPNGQNVQSGGIHKSTAESIATEYGLNEKTVRRYGQEAALIDQHPEKAT